MQYIPYICAGLQKTLCNFLLSKPLNIREIKPRNQICTRPWSIAAINTMALRHVISVTKLEHTTEKQRKPSPRGIACGCYLETLRKPIVPMNRSITMSCTQNETPEELHNGTNGREQWHDLPRGYL